MKKLNLRGAAWLVALLQEQPAVSLDGLQLKRPDAQTDQIDARVSLSLWVADAPADGGAEPARKERK